MKEINNTQTHRFFISHFMTLIKYQQYTMDTYITCSTDTDEWNDHSSFDMTNTLILGYTFYSV